MDEHDRPEADPAPDAASPRRHASVRGTHSHHAHLRDAVATMLVLFVLASSVALLAWPRGVDDEATCRALFDRWTELRIRQAEPSVPGAELEHRKEQARSSAERGGAFTRCVEHADRDALQCSERANGIDELERCFP